MAGGRQELYWSNSRGLTSWSIVCRQSDKTAWCGFLKPKAHSQCHSSSNKVTSFNPFWTVHQLATKHSNKWPFVGHSHLNHRSLTPYAFGVLFRKSSYANEFKLIFHILCQGIWFYIEVFVAILKFFCCASNAFPRAIKIRLLASQRDIYCPLLFWLFMSFFFFLLWFGLVFWSWDLGS